MKDLPSTAGDLPLCKNSLLREGFRGGFKL